MSDDASEQLRESKKKAHGELRADMKKIEAERERRESLGKKGGHRGPAGR
jgi:hypothetical protein